VTEMEKRRILSVIVGIFQSVIGVLSAVFLVLLFFNILEFETFFNLPADLLPVYMVILGLFSLFSVISGVFLIRELRR